MSKERIFWFDFLRGLAILMVVSIHTFSATVQQGSLTSDLIILQRQVLNCAVPLFLAISGYFLAKRKASVPILQFWKRQIPKVYIPTLIWSLPYLALFIWQGNDWLKGIVIFAVCGFSIYYFIALIIQYYLLFPVLKKPKSKEVFFTFVITMIATCFVSYLDLIKGYGMSSIVKGGSFPIWLVFFVVGIYLGNRKERTYCLWPWLLCLVGGLILSFLETKWVYPLHHIGYGIKPSSHVYSLAVIILLFSEKVQSLFAADNWIVKTFVYLGRISFGVYLVHCFFIMFIIHFIHLNWASLTVGTLALTIAFIYVTQRLVPAIARKVGFY